METKTKNLTILGKAVEWMDSVFVSGKIVALIFLVFVLGVIVSKQSSGWNFFENTQAAALEKSELPDFSPEKKILAGSGQRCRNNENMIKDKIGRHSFKQFAFKKNAEQIIRDKPMKEMMDAVAGRDIGTASYLVAIAKKESNLGKFSPKDADGRNCYNYWGYRGSQNTTKSGYSCFDSPEQAVEVVGNRIQNLSQIGKFDTPQKMAVWKCGYDCSWDNQANVKKWIADVEMYYEKLNL